VGSSAGITVVKDLNFDSEASDDVNDISEITAGFDIDGDGEITATHTPGIKEVITGCKLGQYDQYADEILSEQKILALIYRDAYTNEYKILHYEFLE